MLFRSVSAGDRGSGGMASKLAAARIASWSGVRTVIARARREQVLVDAVNESPTVGTTFTAHDRRLTARKLWIAFAAQARGTVLVDDGARDALTSRGSCRPVGTSCVCATAAAATARTSSSERAFARCELLDDDASARAVVAAPQVGGGEDELHRARRGGGLPLLAHGEIGRAHV